MNHEPRKHHYIPQFILRNFCNDNNQVNYWDIESGKLEQRNTKSIFMNKDMYRSEQLSTENPTQIEYKFSVFEREIAELLTDKGMVDSHEITLTRGELEKLRIFTTLLSFRSDSRMKQYEKSLFDELTKKILLKYQPDGDFENLWKRELNTLTECRTYAQISDSDTIDPIIKTDFQSDLRGYYMTFVEARGGQFLLSDIYPTLEIFPMPKANIHMHYIFPLSPTRAMLLNHVMFKKENDTDLLLRKMINLSKIKGEAITPPKNRYANGIVFDKKDEYVYKVKRIYAEDVKYINALILNEARVGIMFQDAGRVINSISTFNSRNDTKQKYLELEDILIEG